MDKFVNIRLSYVSASNTSVFLFPDDYFSNCQWIFTKLGVCLDIVEIWFEIVNGQISLCFCRLTDHHMSIVSFPDDNLSKYQWIFAKLSVGIDNVEISFGIANGQIFDTVVCPPHVPIFVPDDYLSKYQWIFTKLGMCFDIVEIW